MAMRLTLDTLGLTYDGKVDPGHPRPRVLVVNAAAVEPGVLRAGGGQQQRGRNGVGREHRPRPEHLVVRPLRATGVAGPLVVAAEEARQLGKERHLGMQRQ